MIARHGLWIYGLRTGCGFCYAIMLAGKESVGFIEIWSAVCRLKYERAISKVSSVSSSLCVKLILVGDLVLDRRSS